MTTLTAEVIGFAFVLMRCGCCGRLDGHAADRIELAALRSADPPSTASSGSSGDLPLVESSGVSRPSLHTGWAPLEIGRDNGCCKSSMSRLRSRSGPPPLPGPLSFRKLGSVVIIIAHEEYDTS